jgi:hypothetical protein
VSSVDVSAFNLGLTHQGVPLPAHGDGDQVLVAVLDHHGDVLDRTREEDGPGPVVDDVADVDRGVVERPVVRRERPVQVGDRLALVGPSRRQPTPRQRIEPHDDRCCRDAREEAATARRHLLRFALERELLAAGEAQAVGSLLRARPPPPRFVLQSNFLLQYRPSECSIHHMWGATVVMGAYPKFSK